MFALAANGFNKPSETFIRAHARGIAPGRTLLIAERRDIERPIDAPIVILSKHLPILIGRDGGRVAALASLLSPGLFGGKDARLAAILRRMGVETVMVEYGVVALPLLDAVARAGCRLYVHFHGVDASKMLRDPDIVAAYPRLFAQADGIITPSRFLAERLREVGCPPEKQHVVPCGVDVEAIMPTDPVPGRLIAVGRFTPKKAPLATIDAFAAVTDDFPDARLDMVGDGPLRADAEARVTGLGLTDRVTFHGSVPAEAVHRLMSRSGMMVQHSVTAPDGDTEGLPVAILEAMAAALPVVSTRHSGIPEAVVEGKTGLLVDEGDVEGMARCMAALLSEPGRAREMGRAGRARVEAHFALADSIAALRAIMGL